MLTHACKLLVSFSLLLLGACDLKPEVIGATLPDAEGASTTGDPTTGDPTSTTTEPTTGAPDGTPCQLGPPEAWEEGKMPEPGAPIVYDGGRIVTPGPDCAGDVCLYAADVIPPDCEDDAACVGDPRLTGTCGEFRCDVDPAWGEAHTTCTRLCEVDTDCPVIPGCVEGPVCNVITKLGSLCCQKICACRDELSEGSLEAVEFDCNQDMFCP
ncbi:MAG TPA: hypothetical protein VGB85_23160 [Nannocystis sp.]|jgi:hypothetical protein